MCHQVILMMQQLNLLVSHRGPILAHQRKRHEPGHRSCRQPQRCHRGKWPSEGSQPPFPEVLSSQGLLWNRRRRAHPPLMMQHLGGVSAPGRSAGWLRGRPAGICRRMSPRGPEERREATQSSRCRSNQREERLRVILEVGYLSYTRRHRLNPIPAPPGRLTQ